MDRIYAKLHPGILQAIMEFERAEDVIRRFSREAQEELDEVLGLIYEDLNEVIPLTRARAYAGCSLGSASRQTGAGAPPYSAADSGVAAGRHRVKVERETE
jgi:hypothetical protein